MRPEARQITFTNGRAHSYEKYKVDRVGQKKNWMWEVTQITYYFKRFWSVHLTDTFLSHEATGEEMWMIVKPTKLRKKKRRLEADIYECMSVEEREDLSWHWKTKIVQKMNISSWN